MSRNIEIKIQNKIIGRGRPTFIIAEAGVNHNGKLNLALKLVDIAAKVGADAVKFQTFKAEEVVTETVIMADYQKKNIGKGKSQFEMLRNLELSESWYPKIIKRCKDRGVMFFSTPHGSFTSVNILQNKGVQVFKIGSGDLNNIPFLRHVAKFRKPIILSTGMADMKEVQEAVRTIKLQGNNKIIVLHCTTNYPCPYNEVNLRAMQTMMKKLNTIIGYSDHTLGSQVPVMAVTLGATVIEKHLTLDNNMPGPDHRASANPEVFKEMVDEIRKVEIILGSPVKKPTFGEKKLQAIVRKSLVATSNIKAGDKFTKENIGIKRPGSGLDPKHYFKLIGLRSKRNIKKDQLIKKNDF